MAKIDDAVEGVLVNEPHLTRAEAIKVVTKQFEVARIKKQCKKKQRDKKRKRKNKPSKSSVRTVSGGAVSPR